jgi:hypothetical protein
VVKINTCKLHFVVGSSSGFLSICLKNASVFSCLNVESCEELLKTCKKILHLAKR